MAPKTVDFKKLVKLYKTLESAQNDRDRFVQRSTDRVSDEYKLKYAGYMTALNVSYRAFITCADYILLDDMVNAVQRRCSARTISVQQIVAAVSDLDDYFGITKKALDKTRVIIDPCAQAFPNAYRNKSYGPPMSTTVTVEHKNGYWKLITIQRSPCDKYVYDTLYMGEECKTAILNKYRHF